MTRSKKRQLEQPSFKDDIPSLHKTVFYCAFELLDYCFMAMTIHYLNLIADKINSGEATWSQAPINMNWLMRVRGTYVFTTWFMLLFVEPLVWMSVWRKKPMLQQRSTLSQMTILTIAGIGIIRLITEMIVSIWLMYTAFQACTHASWLKDHLDYAWVYLDTVASLCITRLIQLIQTHLKKNPQHPFHKFVVIGEGTDKKSTD